MKKIKKALSTLLVLAMITGLLPVNALADSKEPVKSVENVEISEAVDAEGGEASATDDVSENEIVTEDVIENTEPEEEMESIEAEVPALAAAAPQAVTMDMITKTKSVPLDTSKFYTIFHLDCGRNYFSVQQIKNIIDEMAKDGYNTLELAVGNDALRLVLDDMSVTANGKTYDSTTVANALKNGNSSYRNNGTNQLTQSEMDTIIAYANSKNIAIIPLVNAPGHANTMLAIMNAVGISNPAYNSDPRTIDVRNAEAVNFSLALVNKYIQYFASKGCKIFNMGADEYANTSYSSGSMGFGHLQSAREYGYYADYVNNMAAQIQNAGMTAMAFNDGIYFNSKTTSTFDSDITIAYWSSGFGSYIPAPASFLANKGHKIINTNDGWYYVMGRATGTYSYQTAINGAKNTKVTDIPGENDPTAYGAMVCLWYDNSATYSESNTFTLLSTLAENNAEYFTVPAVDPEPQVETVFNSDNTKDVSVTALALNSVSATSTSINVDGYNKVLAYDVTPKTAEGNYVGAATVSFKVPVGWNTSKMTGFIVTDSKIELIDGSMSAGYYTFEVPHFSVMGIASQDDVAEELPYDVLVELKVGETSKNYTETSGTYEPSYPGNLDGVATAKVEINTIPGETNVVLGNAVSATVTSDVQNGKYIIGDGNGHYVMRNDTSVSYTSDINKATQWTLQNNGSSFTLMDGNYYFRNRTNRDPSNGSQNISTLSQRGGWNYDRYGLYYGSYHLIWYNNSSFSMRSSTNSVAKLYSFTTKTTDGGKKAIVSFVGNTAGTTYLTVGGTTYKVVVKKNVVSDSITIGETKTYTDTAASTAICGDTSIVGMTTSGNSISVTAKAIGETTIETATSIYTIKVVAEDLSKVNPVTIDWWITNYPITSTDANHTPDTSRTDNGKTVYSTKLAASVAYGEDGVAMADVVPATGKFEYSGSEGCVFWKGTHLTSSNKQTAAGGVDQTAVGDAATYIRYYNKQWQYSADHITWKNIASTDQMVAYYLQATKVTKEVTTMTKDWGIAVGEQDGVATQVALSVAVVYPDGTLSPVERDIYNNSTLIFNYWTGRDIGIVAPVINDDYEVEKMTVTPGSRVTGKTGIFTTGTSDGINWEKKTTASGTQWFNETTYWDETVGGAPMVNGATSNIIWSAANKAYLVLIYLKPVHHDSNLSVKWVDDTTNTVITSQEIVVDYTGSTAPTFLTDIVNSGQKGASAGTIDLKDDAYIVNKAGVNQTFNKDLTKMQNIAGQYTSGLYQYVSADISSDGKTLTLHYSMDENKLSNNYVVDFGLGVDVLLSDFGITNASNIAKVTTTNNATYTNGTITFKPNSVMNGVETVTARVEFKTGNPQTLNIGFVPATSVYYEEGFATMNGFMGGSKGSAKQAKQKAGESTDEYGYDVAYASNSAASAGTEAVASAKGNTATLNFVGTGVDVYFNCASDTGNVTAQVVDANGKTVKLVMAYTKANGAYGSEVSNAAYNTRVIAIKGLAHGSYTLKLSAATANVKLDGYRIYGTIANQAHDAYTADYEDNPSYLQMRNAVLTAINAATKDSADVYAQVFEKTNGQMTGAVVAEVKSDNSTDAETMLNDGPKNELYLAAGQALTFKVTTDRKVQIGLKAPNGATTCTVNGTTKDINSSVDMFYTINSGLVTINNTGSKVLSVTDLKVCDAPAVLGELSESDIESAIAMMNGPAVEDPEEPEVPASKVATLVVTYTKSKKTVGTVTLTKVQAKNEKKATFTKAEIANAAPAGYKATVKKDASVKFGSTSQLTVECKELSSSKQFVWNKIFFF